MRRLSLIAVVIIAVISLAMISRSPHGDNFTMDCEVCHNEEGWTIDKSQSKFDHTSTGYALIGMHKEANCRQCHPSLVFAEASTSCTACHSDMHEQTVGMDCERCHTPQSWIVNNTSKIHQQSRFPLLGAHAVVPCSQCHVSASLLKFEPLGIACFDCHQKDYQGAQSPNHVSGNYSTQCTECHLSTSFSWAGAGINHSFLPLTLGHENVDCQQCHKTPGNYANVEKECFSCHEGDYNASVNPSHSTIGLSTNCTECHTTNVGWQPASFQIHDSRFFPIYSGKHKGEWQDCSSCHTQAGNYSTFSCTDCHEHNQSDMNGEHEGIGGYTYSSDACFQCHPTGDAEGGFNHSASGFPLTGAHTTTACNGCHASGYAGTPTACGDCHLPQYNQTTNPNHSTIGLATDCGACHTTEAGWKPATFNVHDNYYPLTGAHTTSNCASCHNGVYSSTPNTCVGCHQTNYNQTSNPNHATAQISTDCASCHTTNSGWKPATFTTHSTYYPLTGAHSTTDCASCHNGVYSNTPNTCVGCHQTNYNQTSNPNHSQAGITTDCASCHTTNPDWKPATFTIHNNYYPLTGAHSTTDCASCHNGVYSNTPNTCVGCHQTNYNQTTNPNHSQAGITTDCASCHTTNPDWKPASFTIHNNYYPLTGAHATTDCASCHNGVYSNTPNTCVGCHQANYTQTTNPPHASAQFPTDCESCHTPSGWSPSTFNHDGQYFPIYSGKHKDEWNTCSECHPNTSNYAVFTCIDCHEHNKTEMDSEHSGVSGYSYNSQACLNCHPTGNGGKALNRIMNKQF